MKLERNFEVAAPTVECRERARAFCTGLGFAKLPGGPLVFVRGSLLGSMTGLSPRRWKARISVTLDELAVDRTRVSLRYSVNTTGQIVNDSEQAYLSSEVAGFEAALQSGNLDPAPFEQQLRSVKRLSGKMMLVVSVCGIGLGLGSGALILWLLPGRWDLVRDVAPSVGGGFAVALGLGTVKRKKGKGDGEGSQTP